MCDHVSDACIADETSSGGTNSFAYSDIKVTVGIDEDLKMILEMDPSIVDLGADIIGCTPTSLIHPYSNDMRKIGLPPISGGYVRPAIRLHRHTTLVLFGMSVGHSHKVFCELQASNQYMGLDESINHIISPPN